MPGPIYSSRIWAGESFDAGSWTFTLDDTHPVYVIRDVDVIPSAFASSFLLGFYLQIQGVGPVWGMGIGATLPGLSYHWRGRAVAYAGETLQLDFGEAGWSFAIHGYAFRAPTS